MALYLHPTPDPRPDPTQLVSTSIHRVPSSRNSALSILIRSPSSNLETANCTVHVGSGNYSHSHCFHIFMFCYHGIRGMEMWGLCPGLYIFNRTLPAGSNVTTLLILIAFLSLLLFQPLQLHRGTCIWHCIGLLNGGWGEKGDWRCSNVAKDKKNIPSSSLCYLLVSWALPSASQEP